MHSYGHYYLMLFGHTDAGNCAIAPDHDDLVSLVVVGGPLQ